MRALAHWLHVLCTPLLTVPRIATGRSHFDEELNGIVIHDYYASYFALEGVRHGACNAHHLRELQTLIGYREGRLGNEHAPPPHRAHRAARFAREKDRDVPVSMVARISQAWDRALERAIASHEEMPPLQSG